MSFVRSGALQSYGFALTLLVALPMAAVGQIASSAAAQTAQFTGRVTGPDQASVPDARVRIVDHAAGTEHQTTTNADGDYVFSIQPGTYKVTVVAYGFDTVESEPITVTAGQKRVFDAQLRIGGVAQSVTVTESVETADAREIRAQRESMDLKSNLSVESYGIIADGNLAEFLKFMTGADPDGSTGTAVNVKLRGMPASYTQVTYDGVNLVSSDANNGSDASRSFNFEHSSLAGIDSIEVSKTVSADVDANAPAGTINIRPKKAFDFVRQHILLQVAGATQGQMWDSRRTGPQEGGFGGQRFLPNLLGEYASSFFNRRLGLVVAVGSTQTYVEREQITMGRNYVPTAASPDPLAATALDGQMSARETRRTTGSFNVDYRASNDLVLSVVSSINRNIVWQAAPDPTLTTGARTRGVDGNPAFDFTTKQLETTNTVAVTNALAYKRNRGATVIPGFEFKRKNSLLDGKVFYSQSSSDYDSLGGIGQMQSLTNSLTARGNFQAVRSNDPMLQDWKIRQVSGGDWSDPSSWTLNGTPTVRTRSGSLAKSEQKGAMANWSTSVGVGHVPVTFKTGFKYQTLTYNFDNTSDNYLYAYTGPLSNADFLKAIQSSNQIATDKTGYSITTLSGSHDVYLPSMTKLADMFKANPGQWTHTLSATNWYNSNVANRKNYTETTPAFYGMATANLSRRWTARVGLRWEQTRTSSLEFDSLSAQSVAAAGYPVKSGLATTIEGLQYQYFSQPQVNRKGDYSYFFPSASAKYAINEDTDLQFGYSRTITRPEVTALSGVWSVDDVNKVVTAPNPNLKPALSDNFSVRLARYFQPVGFVAANFYLNRTKGLFQSQELTAEEFGNTDPQYANYTFVTTSTVKGDAVNIKGVELEGNHRLTFLPSQLKGFSVRESFMWNHPDLPIIGAATKIFSASVSYTRGRASLNLSGIWTDDKYRSTTPSYYAKRVDLNLSGGYRIMKRCEAFFSFRNILNQPINVIVTGNLDPSGTYGMHSAIYVNNGFDGIVGLRFMF
jgi:TonB-dependent receptor